MYGDVESADSGGKETVIIKGDKRRFIGAVAGAVVKGDAEEVAHENGMYVIVQSGKAMEIIPVPEGFKAREW